MHTVIKGGNEIAKYEFVRIHESGVLECRNDADGSLQIAFAPGQWDLVAADENTPKHEHSWVDVDAGYRATPPVWVCTICGEAAQ